MGTIKEVRRLAVVTPYYPPVIGGAENQLRLLVHEFVSRGIQVDLYTSTLPSDHGLYISCNHKELLNVFPCSPACGTGSLWPTDILKQLKLGGRRYDGSLILFSSVFPDTVISVAEYFKKIGIRSLIRISSRGRLDQLSPAKRRNLFLLSSFVVHSRYEADKLVAEGLPRSHVFVIPNAVPDCFWRNSYRDENFCSERRRLLFAGRYDLKKRIDLLLAAWNIVWRQLPYAELRIVASDTWELWKGKSDLRGVLLDTASRLRLERLKFLPERTQEEMVAEYQIADFAINPSENEGMSNFILEAMASGLPILCSDIPENDFVVQDKNGWRFQVGDSDSMALVIISALSMQGDRLREIGARNRNWVKACLSARRVVDLYIEALTSLINFNPTCAFDPS